MHDYHGILPVFNEYIVDTPEEVSAVLARKVSSNIMSVFSAVSEQHPEWEVEEVIAETNMILMQQGREPMFRQDEPQDSGGGRPTAK